MSTDVCKARIMTVMRDLPPLPEVTRQLMVVLRDDSASARDVAKVLSSDQALTGKVLRLVNSSFYGIPKEVSKISRAIVILGFTGTRNLALGFGSVETLQKLGGSPDLNGFWNHALANGAACQVLVPHANVRIDPDEASIAGLRHDIGAYVLATAVPGACVQILTDRKRGQLEREAAEIGLTHAQVGQDLLQYWQLPDPFCDAAQFHHDVERATDGERPPTNLGALADVLAVIHGDSCGSRVSGSDLLALMGGPGVTLDGIKAVLKDMDQKIEDIRSSMKIAGTGAATGAPGEDAPVTGCVAVTTEDA